MDALEQGAVFKDDVDKDSLIVPPLQARRQKLARSQVRLRQKCMFRSCGGKALTQLWSCLMYLQ